MVLLEDDVCVDGLRCLIEDIVNDGLDNASRQLLLHCRLIAIPKNGPGLRPIAMGESFFKLACLFCLDQVMDQLVAFFEPLQVAVGSKAGLERAYRRLLAAMEACGSNGAALFTDVSNAFMQFQ